MIQRHGWRVAALTALLVALSALPPGQLVDYTETLTLDSGTTCTLRLRLLPDHIAHRARMIDAARESLNQYGEWFSPYPYDHLTIVDTGRESTPGGPFDPGTISVGVSWLQPDRSLTLESQVAGGIARLWWGGSVKVPDRFLADGLAVYAQSRILERLFDRRHQRVNYSLHELRVFGDLVPWAIRALRLDRQTSGVGRQHWRRDPAVDLRDPREARRPAQAARTATALVTLERYLGWPAFQRGLSAAAKTYAGRSMSAAAFATTVSDAADRDLSWFFDQAFSSGATFDYAVDAVTSTTVVLGRHGNATFTGTAKPRLGEYESGRAIQIEVVFADGQKVVEFWDGRSASKTLQYQSPSPIISARIDPARILLLDLNALNDVRSVAAADKRWSLPWAVRWTIWLQDAMQTASLFF